MHGPRALASSQARSQPLGQPGKRVGEGARCPQEPRSALGAIRAPPVRDRGSGGSLGVPRERGLGCPRIHDRNSTGSIQGDPSPRDETIRDAPVRYPPFRYPPWRRGGLSEIGSSILQPTCLKMCAPRREGLAPFAVPPPTRRTTQIRVTRTRRGGLVSCAERTKGKFWENRALLAVVKGSLKVLLNNTDPMDKIS